ncbi:MAG: TonB-dependent receptor, partial [Flavobacteriales bacterium]
MNISLKSITVVLATVFFCISAAAQTDTIPPRIAELIRPLPISVDLMVPLEISEKRLSGFGSSAGRNVQLITAKELEQLPVKTFNEALLYVSGVDMRQRGPLGAQADLSIQGSTFEQVLILINGIPMRDPQTGHHQLNLPI